jgi:hypothetical protein
MRCSKTDQKSQIAAHRISMLHIPLKWDEQNLKGSGDEVQHSELLGFWTEEAVLNYLVINPHSNLDIARAVESVVLKLPHTLGMEFMSKIRSVLEESKSFRPNMSKRELEAMRSLRLNKDIRILHSDKGNCIVVLDESKYKDKLNTLL